MDVAIVFLPLLGALIAGLLGRQLGDRACEVITCSLLVVSAILAVVTFFDVVSGGHTRTTELFTWVVSGSFDVTWSLRVDQLTAVMLAVVTIVSSVVHIYSIGYMHSDKSIPRFFSYLSLFTFAMLMLVTADNFLQLYFGWEGVGVCSYLLIGFWYDRPSANAAAIKAFVVNRVGDFGFALGILGTFHVFNGVGFDAVFAATPGKVGTTIDFLGMRLGTLDTLCILLFIGAMGKSAQIGLHTWLADAMEGPTPVSALIHAATMVTAGVFMVCRLSPMFEYAPVALALVTFIGGTTTIFAASIGLVQNDIKKVIAYSTCSQLGYMFIGAGVSAYGGAMFHLFTHAFFKSLLFLCAGSVIHAMSGEQDMRKMGGIWKAVWKTYLLMWMGSLALGAVGILHVFGFAGFYSKDAILEAAWQTHTGIGHYAFWLGTVAAGMTGFYTWRLLLMTFHGSPRADEKVMAHVHESPTVMWLPLTVLAAGALLAGYLGDEYFVGAARDWFWGKSLFVLPAHDTLARLHDTPALIELLPLMFGLGGIALAYVFYVLQPGLPDLLAQRFRGLYLFLLNKWYFDELYEAIFVRPAKQIGHALWKGGDGGTIDRLGPDGISLATRMLARRAGRLQTGYVYHYAFAMLIGVVALISWYLVVRAH